MLNLEAEYRKMKKHSWSWAHFYGWLRNKKQHYPFKGNFELSYRCNLNCIHCYCKGSEDEERELTTNEVKRILEDIHKEGCIELTLTGGDPLIREDFLEIYSYAKRKGFVVSLFTNGQAFTEKIMDYLVKSPPFSIEITLNGITPDTYEAVTQVEGSYLKVMEVIKKLAGRRLPLLLKANCLKENKYEIAKIKEFTEGLLGKGNGKFYFRFDPMISPRLNRDTTPCNYRLSPEELLEVRKSDPEIWEEYERGLCGELPDLERDRDFLYRCTAWYEQFFINPYGRLKFCHFLDKFSVDLKERPFREGFYNVFPQLLKERFKTKSKCKDCSLRSICYCCPARAYLETGDEEAPVPYYCELAKATAEQMQIAHHL